MDTLRLTGSYIVAPARYAHSAVWYALGYPPATPFTVVQPAAVRTAAAARREDDAPPDSLEEEEDVVCALRAAMRDWEEGSSADEAEPFEPATADEVVPAGEAGQRQADAYERTLAGDIQPADIPLPDSPLPLDMDDSPPPSTAPTSCPLAAAHPRALSSLTRLSRRATLCLSRLVVLEELDLSCTKAGADAEPSEREKELVDRVMGEEVERVRAEVEELVEQALEEAREGEEAAREPMELPQESEGASTLEVAVAQGIAVVAAPHGGALTWFTTEMGRAFDLVNISSEGVDTDGFLRAIESLVSASELLAPAATALCAGELLADIRRVRARRYLLPARTRTIEALVESERRERRRLATEALEWLVRLLGFMARCFRRNLDSSPPEEFSTSISAEWDAGFDKHFNWLVRPLFKVILRACPSRASVYTKLALAPGATEEDVRREMRIWLDGVDAVVVRVERVVQRARGR